MQTFALAVLFATLAVTVCLICLVQTNRPNLASVFHRLRVLLGAVRWLYIALQLDLPLAMSRALDAFPNVLRKQTIAWETSIEHADHELDTIESCPGINLGAAASASSSTFQTSYLPASTAMAPGVSEASVRLALLSFSSWLDC